MYNLKPNFVFREVYMEAQDSAIDQADIRHPKRRGIDVAHRSFPVG